MPQLKQTTLYTYDFSQEPYRSLSRPQQIALVDRIVQGNGYRSLTIKNYSYLTEKQLEALANNSPNLLELNLEGCSQFYPFDIGVALKQCCLLRALNLSGINIRRASVHYSGLTQLEWLSCDSCLSLRLLQLDPISSGNTWIRFDSKRIKYLNLKNTPSLIGIDGEYNNDPHFLTDYPAGIRQYSIINDAFRQAFSIPKSQTHFVTPNIARMEFTQIYDRQVFWNATPLTVGYALSFISEDDFVYWCQEVKTHQFLRHSNVIVDEEMLAHRVAVDFKSETVMLFWRTLQHSNYQHYYALQKNVNLKTPLHLILSRFDASVGLAIWESLEWKTQMTLWKMASKDNQTISDIVMQRFDPSIQQQFLATLKAPIHHKKELKSLVSNPHKQNHLENALPETDPYTNYFFHHRVSVWEKFLEEIVDKDEVDDILQQWVQTNAIDLFTWSADGDNALTCAIRMSLTRRIILADKTTIQNCTSLEKISPIAAWLVQHTALRLSPSAVDRLCQQLKALNVPESGINACRKTLQRVDQREHRLLTALETCLDKQPTDIHLFYNYTDSEDVNAFIRRWEKIDHKTLANIQCFRLCDTKYISYFYPDGQPLSRSSLLTLLTALEKDLPKNLETFELTNMPYLFGVQYNGLSLKLMGEASRTELMTHVIQLIDQLPQLKTLTLVNLGLEDQHIQMLIDHLEKREAPIISINIGGNLAISLAMEEKLSQTLARHQLRAQLQGSGPQLLTNKLLSDNKDRPVANEPLLKSNPQVMNEVAEDKPEFNVKILSDQHMYSVPDSGDYVEEVEVDGDGNCAFSALDADRATVKSSFLSVLNSPETNVTNREKKAIVIQQLSKELLHLCVDDRLADIQNTDATAPKKDDASPASTPLYRFYQHQAQCVVDQLKQAVTQGSTQQAGPLGTVENQLQSLPKPNRFSLAPYLDWIKTQCTLIDESNHSTAWQYLNKIEQSFQAILIQQNKCRKVTQAFLDEQQDPNALDENQPIAPKIWDTFFADETTIRTYIDYAYADNSVLYGSPYSLALYAGLNGQTVSIYTLNNVHKLQQTDQAYQLTANELSTLSGQKELNGQAVRLLYTYSANQDPSKRKLNHYNKLKPIAIRDLNQRLRAVNHVSTHTPIKNNLTDDTSPLETIDELYRRYVSVENIDTAQLKAKPVQENASETEEAFRQTYHALHGLVKEIASIYLPDDTRRKALEGAFKSKTTRQWHELDTLQFNAVLLMKKLNGMPQILINNQEKNRKNFSRLHKAYHDFIGHMGHGMDGKTITPLRQLATVLSVTRRQYDLFTKRSDDYADSIIPDKSGYTPSQKAFFNKFTHTISTLYLASPAITSGVQGESDRKFTMREEVEAFGLSVVSIAGACAKPIAKGALKAASKASDKIAGVIDKGQSLIDSAMENEAVAAAVEAQMTEQSNVLLKKLIKKTTGKKLLDTHSMLSNLCNSFNTSLDVSKEVCALAEALVKCYAAQVDSLTPLEAEQWAEVCANHMLEGLMLGFFTDTRSPDGNAFVERALYWLMYVPMEEPINLGIGKLRQDKQFFGEGNHLNADVLLKGPSLRCEDDKGESIDFHLGNVEVEPSDDLNACFWRKRNFSHLSYDHSPLGYRLAMPWEVERLRNSQDVEQPCKKIATVNITQPKVISQTPKDKLNKAKPIDLDLAKCRALAYDEAIQRLSAEIEAVKKEFNEKIETIKEEHQVSVEKLKNEYSGKLNTQKEAYQQKLNDLEKTYKDGLDDQEQEFNKKLINLEAIYDIKILNLEKENKNLNDRISIIQEENINLKGIVKQLMSRVKKLEQNQSAAQHGNSNKASSQSHLQAAGVFKTNGPRINMEQTVNSQTTNQIIVPSMVNVNHE